MIKKRILWPPLVTSPCREMTSPTGSLEIIHVLLQLFLSTPVTGREISATSDVLFKITLWFLYQLSLGWSWLHLNWPKPWRIIKIRKANNCSLSPKRGLRPLEPWKPVLDILFRFQHSLRHFQLLGHFPHGDPKPKHPGCTLDGNFEHLWNIPSYLFV